MLEWGRAGGLGAGSGIGGGELMRRGIAVCKLWVFDYLPPQLALGYCKPSFNPCEERVQASI